MIDLNELLHGNPSWNQIQDFWKNGEFDQEYYLIEAIEKHLLTEDQRNKLFYHRLTLEKILNGRFCRGKEEECADNCFKEWNNKLGFKSFGF